MHSKTEFSNKQEQWWRTWHTSNMLLLWRRLVCVGGLLDVHYQFLVGLVLVNRPRWIVNFITVDIIVVLARPWIMPGQYWLETVNLKISRRTLKVIGPSIAPSRIVLIEVLQGFGRGRCAGTALTLPGCDVLLSQRICYFRLHKILVPTSSCSFSIFCDYRDVQVGTGHRT